MGNVDEHGTPHPALYSRRVLDRHITELLGVAKGVLADGIVNSHEVTGLADWITTHPESAGVWPVSAVRDRLERIFADGRVDDDERDDLAELLRQLVGGDAGYIEGANAATELPLDRPTPAIAWSGSVFVFTGKMASGARKHCQARTATLGGICEDSVTRRTNYLVLGTFASGAWAQTSHGRKIEEAVELRAGGQRIVIVSEEHWAGSST